MPDRHPNGDLKTPDYELASRHGFAFDIYDLSGPVSELILKLQDLPEGSVLRPKFEEDGDGYSSITDIDVFSPFKE